MLLISVLSFIYLPYRLDGKVVYCFLGAIEQSFFIKAKKYLDVKFLCQVFILLLSLS